MYKKAGKSPAFLLIGNKIYKKLIVPPIFVQLKDNFFSLSFSLTVFKPTLRLAVHNQVNI